MTVQQNTQQNIIAINQLCRVKKDCKTITEEVGGYPTVLWNTAWLADWFSDQSTLLPLHYVYDTIYTDDPYGYVEENPTHNPDADYYVDAYLDSLSIRGFQYPGYLIAEDHWWRYDTTLYTKGTVIPLGYRTLLPSTAYGIENINAAMLPTDGNINVFLITWNQRNLIGTNSVSDWTTHYIPVASEIYDSIPRQFCKSLNTPNPVPPSDLDTVIRGTNLFDTIINAHAVYYYGYSFAVSGNRAMLATEPLNLNTNIFPIFYQELKLVRKNKDTFSLNINTLSNDGIVLGLGGNNGYPVPSISGDGDGDAVLYITQYHSWIQASPLGEGGKLWWGNLGAPLSPDRWDGSYTNPDAPYIYMDKEGKSVIAWNDVRKQLDGSYSSNNIYFRHLDSLLQPEYTPPLHVQLLDFNTYYANRSTQLNINGASNAWTTFQALAYIGNGGGSDYTPLALIKDDYDLGTVTVSAQDNIGAIRTTTDGKPYLNRNYTISVTNHPVGASIHVRLIFTKSEFDSLKAYDPTIQDPGDLAVIKQPSSGTNAPSSYTPSSDDKGIKPIGWAAIESAAADGTVIVDGYFIEIVISDFSNFFIGSTSNILPVSLQNFTAVALHFTSVLSWQTASEINNSKFEIERSADGKTFTKIGTVAGHGSSSELHNYSFIDEVPFKGRNYYRLAQVDLDGRMSYSEIRLVDFNERSGAIKVFPNPSKSIVHVQLPTAASGQNVLQLFNSIGSEVLQQTVPAGNSQSDVDISSLAAGVYILKYGTESVKVVKQ